MYFRPKLDDKGKRRAYRLNLRKVRYEINPYIWIELRDDVIRLRNIFSGVYHLFEDGKDYCRLSQASLDNLISKIEKDFD
jgi:hypothetical protein